MSDEIKALENQLHAAREHLDLIEERMSEYVLSTDVPLQLIREQRRLQERIRWLQRRIADLRPIAVLRRATKLLVGPVAETLTGAPCKSARQRLLTQASKLPWASHLDTALMEEAVGDLLQLIGEVQILLAAYRIAPNPGQEQALEQRATRLAEFLMRIYRLEPGEVPQLDAWAAGEL